MNTNPRSPRKDKQLIVHFEDFASRECPFFVDVRGLQSCRCSHPENEEREPTPFFPGPLHIEIGACFIFTCPLGVCLHPETETEDRNLMQRRGFRPITQFSDETWMLTTVGALRGAGLPGPPATDAEHGR